MKCIWSLISIKHLWLLYGGGDKELVSYADAEDKYVMSGYAFLVDGGVVS